MQIRPVIMILVASVLTMAFQARAARPAVDRDTASTLKHAARAVGYAASDVRVHRMRSLSVDDAKTQTVASQCSVSVKLQRSSGSPRELSFSARSDTCEQSRGMVVAGIRELGRKAR